MKCDLIGGLIFLKKTMIYGESQVFCFECCLFCLSCCVLSWFKVNVC